LIHFRVQNATYAPTNGGNTTNQRALALDVPTFDGAFTFSKISSNQDGLIAVKDLNVTGGFGGQVGQGGPISYFKAIGIAAHHKVPHPRPSQSHPSPPAPSSTPAAR
jgi:hypothetical protein